MGLLTTLCAYHCSKGRVNSSVKFLREKREIETAVAEPAGIMDMTKVPQKSL